MQNIKTLLSNEDILILECETEEGEIDELLTILKNYCLEKADRIYESKSN